MSASVLKDEGASGSATLKNNVYSTDFDLMLPFNRKKAEEDMWLQRNGNIEIGRPPPTPEKNLSSSALEDIVRRQEALLRFYQEKYPTAEISQFLESYEASHGDKALFEVQSWSKLSPIWKAYDEKLWDLETKFSNIFKEITMIKTEKVKLMEENSLLRNNHGGASEVMHTKIRLLAEENKILLEQNRKNEAMIQQAFILQRQQEQLDQTVRTLKDEIDSLQRLHERVVSEKSSLERQFTALQAIHQKMLVENETNVRLLRSTKVSLQEADGRALRCENENTRLRKDVEESQRWNLRIVTPILKDYERCLEALGVTPAIDPQLLQPPVLSSAPTISEIIGLASITSRLEDHVRQLMRQSTDLKQGNEIQKHDLVRIEKEYTNLMHKYQMESEEHKASLATSKSYVERLIALAEKSKHERELAYDHSKKLELEVAKLKESLNRTVIESQEQMEKVLDQTRKKLGELETQYEVDKRTLEEEVSGLKRAKMDLQCEVGILLRDKRDVEDELKQVFKDWDTARDSFFQAMKSEQ